MPERLGVFATYVRLWAATELLLLFHDWFLVPHVAYVYPQVVLFAAAFYAPHPHTLAAATAARVA